LRYIGISDAINSVVKNANAATMAASSMFRFIVRYARDFVADFLGILLNLLGVPD